MAAKSPKFEEVEPPFTEEIQNAPLAPKFKKPRMIPYDSSSDPPEHLESYRSWMELHGTTGSTLSKGFSHILFGYTQKWYRNLTLSFIASFAKLSQLFVNHFKIGRSMKKPKSHLFTIL